MKKKCQVVMLPTNEKAILWLTPNNKLTTSTLEVQPLHGKRELNWKGQHLYFVSDEEIKQGDWFLNDLNQIKKCTSRDVQGYIDFEGGFNTKPSSCKKIIATTDNSLTVKKETDYRINLCLPQPSQSFIEMYVNEYNKGNVIKEVLVEYTWEKIRHGDGRQWIKSKEFLKVNPRDNTITINKVKDNWNREEVEQLCWQAFIEHKCVNDKIKPSEAEGLLEPFNKWIKEYL